MKRLVILAIVALSAALPARATTFIKDVMLVGGSGSEVTALKNTLLPQGWIDSGQDLNRNAGGDFIYLLYKTENNPDDVNEGYITGFGIYTEDSPNSLIYGGRTYHLVPFDGGAHFKNRKGDLNSNAGGADIHLYYTRDAFPENSAVTNLWFSSSGSGAVGKFGETDGYDLNKNAGGDFIYLHVDTAPTGHRTHLQLDTCVGGDAQIAVSGWARDPDTNQPVTVRFRVYKEDGVTFVKETSLTANQPKDGMTGNHGFSGFIYLIPGSYRIEVFADDLTGNGVSRVNATQTVTVTPGLFDVTIGNLSYWEFARIPYYFGSGGRDPNVSQNKYSLTQQIYTAEEIGTPGCITAIAFYGKSYPDGASFEMDGMLVYLAHTDKTEFANGTDFVRIGADDQVFEGTFRVTNAGWSTIELDTPFDYDGERNLLVCFYDPTDEGPVRAQFCTHRCASKATLSFRSQGRWTVPPDFDQLPFYHTLWDITLQQRNDIRFTIVPSIFAKPVNLAMSNCTATWRAPDADYTVTGYAYQFKMADDEFWSAEETTTATSATIGGLTPETTYDFRVKALYGNGCSIYETIRFSTPASDYEIWAATNGVAGAWDAADAGGIHNVFRYAFDKPNGAFILLDIHTDALGRAVITTPPLVNHEDFGFGILATDDLVSPTSTRIYPLEPSGTNTIPISVFPARFFRLMAVERLE